MAEASVDEAPTLDTTSGDPGSAADAADAEAGARDAPATDARVEARVNSNSSVWCGPSLECSLANPAIGCCVTFRDSGTPPANYGYACLTSTECVEAGGPATEIKCDNGKDCPNPSNICCWPSTSVPRVTYCFLPDASNCTWELCDPNAAVPCINHPGYACVPSGPPYYPLAPLGYYFCVRDAG